MDCSCQSLINPIKELQQAGSNVLLTWGPSEKTHGPMAIVKKMLEAMTNVTKSRALKNIVPLITHRGACLGKKQAAHISVTLISPDGHLLMPKGGEPQ